MENTRKQLTALNSDSIRSLVNAVNERGIQRDDVLGNPICINDSYYLLYYEDCD